MAHRARQRLVPLLRLALTLGSLAWIVHWLGASGRGLRMPSDFHWGPAAAALALVPAGLFLRAWKWRLTAALLEPAVTLRESFASYVGAVPLSLLTPGRLGEFSRGLYLPHASLRGWRASGLVAVDKYTDLLAVLAWSVPGMGHLLGAPGAAAALALLALLVPLPSWLSALVPRREVPGNGVLRRTLNLVPPARFLTVPRMLGLGLAGCAAFGLEWIQLSLLLEAAGSGAPFLTLAGMAAFITLLNTLQLTIAGLGVREGLAIAWLVPLGVPAEAALFAVFALFCLDVLIPAGIGLAMSPHGLGVAGNSGPGMPARVEKGAA